MEMPIYADEGLLDQVLRAIPVADRPVDEVQETRLVALGELVEGMASAVQVLRYKRRVIQLSQGPTAACAHRRAARNQ